jgi:hypothetical protein
MMMSHFKSLNAIQNADGGQYSMMNRVLENFKKDAAANKVIKDLEADGKLLFDVQHKDDGDSDIYTTERNGESGKTKVTLDMQDLNAQAETLKIDPEVYLAQQMGSILAGVYFQNDAIENGQNPQAYATNAEYQVGKALVADGFVRRTYGAGDSEDAKAVVAHLDEGRANLDKTLTEQYGEKGITTSESDAFERFEKLGFIGLEKGGAGKSLNWADDITGRFGIKQNASAEDLKAETESEATESDEAAEEGSQYSRYGERYDNNAETEKSHSHSKKDKTDKTDKTDKSEKANKTDKSEETEEASADESEETETANADGEGKSFFNFDNLLALGGTGLSVLNRKEHSTLSTVAQAGLSASGMLVDSPVLKKLLPAAGVAWNLLGGNKKKDEAVQTATATTPSSNMISDYRREADLHRQSLGMPGVPASFPSSFASTSVPTTTTNGWDDTAAWAASDNATVATGTYSAYPAPGMSFGTSTSNPTAPNTVDNAWV